jgi:hypothetical protein
MHIAGNKSERQGNWHDVGSAVAVTFRRHSKYRAVEAQAEFDGPGAPRPRPGRNAKQG